MVGSRYNYLTVISDPRPDDRGRKRVMVRCDCGVEKEVAVSALTSGTKSCGCFRRKKMRLQKTTHGQTGTRLYGIWASMVQRCTDPNCVAYKEYGHLQIHKPWRQFVNFQQWAHKSGYSEHLTIDRKKGEEGYNPSNCQWATRQEQSQNRKKRSGCTSQYIGVCKSESKWLSYASPNGKLTILGKFDTEYEAAVVRDKFVADHYSNPRLNF